jgi:hypothetical protein
LDAGNYTVVVTSSGVCNPSSITSTSAAVIINENPVISVNPVDRTICEAGNVSFDVVAGGTGITYQWRENGIAIVNGSIYSGSTSSILTITNAPNSINTNSYDVVVTGVCGTISSTAALLTINPLPLGTNDALAQCSDALLNYSLQSNIDNNNGVASTFTWVASNNPNVSGESSGTQTASFITDRLINITANPEVVTYTITPTSVLGSCTGAQFTLTITVNPMSVGIVQNVIGCSEVASGITITTTGSSAATSGFNISTNSNGLIQSSGTISAGINKSANELADDAWINNGLSPVDVVYTITPISSIDGCLGEPFNIVFKVNPAPVGQAISLTTCSDVVLGNSALLNTLATGVSASSYIINSIAFSSGTLTASAGVPVTGSNKPANELVNDAWTNQTGSDVDVIYTISPVTSEGCVGNNFTVIVTVQPEPVGSSETLTPVCSDTPLGYSINVSNAATFNITINSNGLIQSGGSISSGSGKILTELTDDQWTNTSLNDVNVVYTITPISSSGCAGDEFIITVPIKPEPLGLNASSGICSNTSVNYDLQLQNINTVGNSLISTFTWIAASNPAVQGESISSQSGGVINDVLINTTSVVQVVEYTIIPTGLVSGCNGNSFKLFVTVNPEPVGLADAVVACSDIQVNYNLLNNIALLGNNVGSTFVWSAANNPNVTGESATNQNGSLITDVLTNITNTTQIVDYTVIATSANGCVGQPFVISVSVSPEPLGLNASLTICSDLTVGYDLQQNINTLGNNLPANFTWVANSNPIVTGESTSLQSGSIITDILVNNTNFPESVVYTIYPQSQALACAGNSFTITIVVNPKAKVSAGLDLAQCEDIPSNVLQGVIDFAPNGILWTGGTGTFSNPTDINATYSFNNPSEINANILLTVTALDPDGAGPCGPVSDQMLLKINPLPVVAFFGLPSFTVPPSNTVENGPIIPLNGTQAGGVFTVLPDSSFIGSTFINVVDRVLVDPAALNVGSNFITYTYTDANSCTNSQTQELFVNPVTNVDFAVLGASVNVSGDFELCTDIGLVKLIGDPDPSEGLAPETQFTAEGPNASGITIIKTGPDYFIQTNNMVSDSYRIRYTFKNQFGAITFIEKSVIFNASPVAVIGSTNNCVDDFIEFTDESTIKPSPFASVINSWQWTFGDGTVSTAEDPLKKYDLEGKYNVTLKVTTFPGGCSNTSAPTEISVGDAPVIDFKESEICNNDFTEFKDLTDPGSVNTITSYVWNFGDGSPDLSGPANGTVPPGTDGGATSGTFKTPKHNYSTFGTYDVTLTVNTDLGCNGTFTKSIFILPYTTVVPVAGNEYFEDFEQGEGGWIKEALKSRLSTPGNIIMSDNSWVWGTPNGQLINSANGSTNAWWTGLNNDSYYPNENSVVNGPCFNLNSLNRPMISLDYFSEAENNLDGAVLQYSINGGIDWTIVGPPVTQVNRDEGINWFNGTTIFSKPGEQTQGSFGWTDKQGAWKTARFNLDMVPKSERDQVRVRIAFSSNDGNAQSFDGFAFDNVFVGEKKRNVLVEHFTTNTNQAADNYLNNLYQTQFTANRNTSDFFNIQYHVNFSTNDPLNFDNPADPDARALFFGVPQPPYTIMDGIIQPPKFNGVTTLLNNTELDRRALVDPQFDLTLDTISTGNSRSISVRLNATVKQQITDPILLQVALLETGIVVDGINYKNVLRKQLFGADGIIVPPPYTIDTPFSTEVTNIDINVPIVNADSLYLVGFVQNKNTREIYQSIVLKAPRKDGLLIVGIDDKTDAIGVLSNIQMFPNPANQVFDFGLPAKLPRGTSWRIIDQRGVTVLTGDFENAVNGKKQVNISELTNEVYFVLITSPEGNAIVRKKLVVMNRN